MLDTLRNLKTSEIQLRQPLPALEGDWLLGRLLGKRGITDAKWISGARKLVVEHDVDLFDSAELVDYLRTCGVPIAGVLAGSAERTTTTFAV